EAPPKLSTADAPDCVPVKNTFRRVMLTPGPIAKMSGSPLNELGVAIPAPESCAPGDVDTPTTVKFGIVTSSDCVNEYVPPFNTTVSPAAGHIPGARVVSHAVGATSFFPNTFCNSAPLLTVIVFVATTLDDADALLFAVLGSLSFADTLAL